MRATKARVIGFILCAVWPAAAVAVPIDYSPVELAAAEINGTVTNGPTTETEVSGTLEIGGSKPNCKLKLGPSVIKSTGHAADCAELWSQTQLAPLHFKGTYGTPAKTAEFSLNPRTASVGDNVVTREDAVVKGAAAFDSSAKLFVFADKDSVPAWLALAATNGVFQLPNNVAKRGEIVFYLVNGGRDFAGKLSKPEAPPVPIVSLVPAPSTPSLNPQDLMDCPAPKNEREKVVCVDLLSAAQDPVTVRPLDGGHVLRPNTDVTVWVRYPQGASVAVSMGGTRGLYRPSALDQAQAVAHAGGSTPKEPPPRLAKQTFTPRQPGEADVVVKMTSIDGRETTHTVELLVEETYSGAVRIGVGFPFGGAVDGKYDLRAVNGSQQKEVVAAKDSKLDFELTVSYSAYVFMSGDKGGRSLVRGCYPGCINPFVAVGVWAPDASGIAFIKSVYAGLEWEPQPAVSIGLGVVARRVRRLQDNLKVGSPADGDEVPMKDAIGLGGGIMLTFSPDFLRIAKPAAASFLK